jgi:hypothetical protein
MTTTRRDGAAASPRDSGGAAGKPDTAPATGDAASVDPTRPDGGQTPAADASAPIDTGSCSAEPRPNAAMAKLAFKKIELAGLPVGPSGGKNPAGITELRFVPNAPDEFFISQKGGAINHFRLEGDTATFVRRYMIAGVHAGADCGLISFAFDPGYATNKLIYAGYCTAENASRLTRFTVTEGALGDPADILTFNEPQGSTAWHAVGTIGFDPKGNLWLLHGEFTRAANAQNVASNLGKLLRLVPSRTPGKGGSTPAEGNMPGGSGLVYAYGFRSPWRGHLDTRGRFLVGDVGPTTGEEVNLVTAAGQNFGWNGSRVGNCSGACTGIVNPLSTYRISNDPYNGSGNAVWEAREGRAVWVGTQYLDCGNDKYGGALTGVYLFGDLYTGWVRGMVIDDAGAKKLDRPLASMASLSSWVQHPNGYLYAAKFGAYGTGGLANETLGVFRVELAPP